MSRLKEIREQRGLYQKDVATAIGKTVSAYSNYEVGRRDLDTETLLALADFYRCTTDYILGRETELKEKENKHTIDDTLYAEIVHLLSKINELDKEDIRSVYQYIDFLKSRKNIGV